MVEEAVGKGYRLGGLVERSQERWWTRERLVPEFIAGHFRARLKGTVRSIRKEACPEDWKVFIDTNDGDGFDLIEHIAGPLDEASSGWEDQTFPVGMLTNSIPTGDAKQAVVALSNALLVLEIPSDLQIARDCAIRVLEAAPDESVAAAIETSLSASMRWKDRTLADKSFAFALETEATKGWPSRLLVEWALASIAGETDPAIQAEMFEREVRRLVERKLSPEQAAGMVSVLDKLQDLLPAFDAIATLRSASILAA